MKPARLLILAAILAAPALAGELPSIDEPLRTGSKAPADAGVVIGIEDYLRPGVPTVPYAKRDAQAFNDFLLSTRGVPTDRVQLLQENAPATKIRSLVTTLGKSVGEGGVAWVYFAGHGGASLNGGARMLLGDDVSQDPESFDGGGVLVSEIEALAGAGGGRVVIVVDACYTGTGRDGQGFLTGKRTMVPGGYTAMKPRSNVVWSAASAGQTSGPLDAAQHGAFTYFALGALRGWADGGLDGVRDGSVTIDEAQTYVQRTLATAQITSQTPEVVGARDVVLSVRVKEAAPVIAVARVETPRTGDAVVVAGTDFQQKLEAAKREAAAVAEREFIATEAAKARAATLDAAEAGLRRQATADWASAKGLVDGGGAGANAAADAFIAAYGTAKVRVDDEERVVVVAELEVARRVAKQAVVATAPSAPVAGGAPPAAGSLDALREQAARFMALNIAGPGPGKFPNKTIDSALKGQLLAEARAMVELDAAVAVVVGKGGLGAGLEALAILGRAYEEFATDLTDSYMPPYLTQDQQEIYRMALEDKAYPQREKARAVWQQIVDTSAGTTLTSSPVVVEAHAALDAFAARSKKDAAEAELRKRALETSGRPKLDELRKQVASMQATLARSRACVPPETSEMADMVIEQALPVIEDQDLSMAGDMLAFARDARVQLDDGVASHCGP